MSPGWRSQTTSTGRRCSNGSPIAWASRRPLWPSRPSCWWLVWHVLSKRIADREAVPERVAGKFLEWSWKVGRVNRRGLTTVEFIRRQLCRVQVGEGLTTVSRGKKTLRLPPPLQPEIGRASCRESGESRVVGG